MAGILVVAEAPDGAVAPISFELLGAARKLSGEGGGNVSAFVAGAANAQALAAAGAGTVYVGTSSALAGAALAEAFLPAVSAAIEQSGADIVLLGQTSLGRDLGPALAYAHKTGVSMDTVGLAIEGGRLKATRSCYGGNARAELTWKAPLQIANVKGKSFDPAEPSGGSGNVVEIAAAGEPRVQVLNTEKAQSTGVSLQDAPIIVSGGRGLGDPSAFAMLEELAGLLKGATGASRAACDMGWYPPSQQVGLTGKVVSPNIYIAVGISGASQHMAGMSGSKNIVAINRDPEANMVKSARFAIVEDYKKILPAFIEEVKKLLA